jgi:uncharacterized membrane protein YgcG
MLSTWSSRFSATRRRRADLAASAPSARPLLRSLKIAANQRPICIKYRYLMFLRSERGAVASEYALLAAAMGGAMLVASWGLKAAMADSIAAAGVQVNSAAVLASTDTGDSGGSTGGSTGGGTTTGGGSTGGGSTCNPHAKNC